MRRIKKLIIILLIFINIPICVAAASFKKGDTVQFKEATQLYEKVITNGENLAELKKATATGKKGKKVTYQGSVMVESIRSIPDGLKGKKLCSISVGKKQYVVATDKLEKVKNESTGDGSGTSGGSGTNGGSSSNKEDEDAVFDYGEDGEQKVIEDERKEEEEREEQDTSIYQAPQINNADRDSAESLDDMMSDADAFLAKGNTQYDDEALSDFSSTLFNIFSLVGAAVALIVGIIIGIKYMMGSVEEKAEYKQMLVPYIIGCIAIFGAFGIWKILIEVLQTI